MSSIGEQCRVIDLTNSNWLTMAEEGEGDPTETGRPPALPDVRPIDLHQHEHDHDHPGSAGPHSHVHLHDHDEQPAHDEPGQTQNFANADDHEHDHVHRHDGGAHPHPHGHTHETPAHYAGHQPENLMPGDDDGAQDAGQLANAGRAAELASVNRAIEMTASAEQRRVAEDAARPPRMSTDAKLAGALDRLARGMYTPSRAATALGLAGEASNAGRALAEARWQAEQANPGICGPPDAIGGCSSRYHDSDCTSSMMSGPEVAAELRDMGVFTGTARSPWQDANGRTWFNQAGMPMDLAQHIEAATGQRVTPLHGESGLFEDGTGARETISASRVPRYGNPDDEDDPGTDITRQTRLAAQQAAQAMGITIPSAVNERARFRDAAEAATAQLALRNGMRLPHPDFGESSQERAARMRQTTRPVPIEEDLMPGELPRYRAGQL